MKALCTDKKKEFILAKFKNNCNKKDITIKYIVSYMHKKIDLRSKVGK